MKHIESIVNEDLANCWTCSNCISKGFHSKLEELKKETATKTSGNNSMNNTLNTNTDSNISTRLNSDDEFNPHESFDDYEAKHEPSVLVSLNSLSNQQKKIILEEFSEIIVSLDKVNSDLSEFSKHGIKSKPKRKKCKTEPEEIEIAEL